MSCGELRLIKWSGGNIRVDYTDKTSITCSITHMPTPVDIEISYVPEKYIVDLDTLHAWLYKMSKNEEMLLEEYALKIFETLKKVLEPKHLLVKVCGTGIHHPYTCITKETEQ